ncbi:MAG: hypothetical protein QM767_22340 [Anaeromyxobacter sp.]
MKLEILLPGSRVELQPEDHGDEPHQHQGHAAAQHEDEQVLLGQLELHVASRA